MTSFGVVPLNQVTARDMEDLHKALDTDDLGIETESVRDSILEGMTLIWRYQNGKGHGIILTQERHGTKGKEMFVWYMGGFGMKSDGHFISNVLEEFARIRGLSRITAIVRPGVRRFLKPFGYRTIKYLVSKEV